MNNLLRLRRWKHKLSQILWSKGPSIPKSGMPKP
ncbi:BnaC03g66060D [Brassica napus]|uniref:BnaC03g66060D protein n=2 Tax=Brassica TaxID=3705 RepID=A0A078I5W0_BRANA|nr:BnaC03g66060D [Brassica napus]VDD00084.1 unnamed protein product [Brassica oleracea]